MSAQKLFHWPIVFMAGIGVLLSMLWFFGALAAGGSMGWSWLSGIQIAAFFLLVLLLPLIGSLVFTFRANDLAKSGKVALGTLFALFSLLSAPLAWLLANTRLFAP